MVLGELETCWSHEVFMPDSTLSAHPETKPTEFQKDGYFSFEESLKVTRLDYWLLIENALYSVNLKVKIQHPVSKV